jgi:Zn-dependent membrane protease YugP
MFFANYGLYILFSLPALLLGLWAQAKVNAAFRKYSQVANQNGLTGAQTARRMLDANGLEDVQIEQVSGMLSDHYDPRSRTLRLSQGVYHANSVAAAGIAAHEAGHALQHQNGYLPLQVRSAMVPTVMIGSRLGPIIFMAGLFLSYLSSSSSRFGFNISVFGLLLFALTALFAIVTLPVELDATRRAKAWLTTGGQLYREEMQGINQVLDAAALTYVAAAIQAIGTVLYYAFILFGGRRRR